MPPAGTPNDFPVSIRRMIAAKARRLVGQCGLRPQDRPDIEQELAARLFPRLLDHDPARSSLEGFAAMLLGQAVANLLRRRQAGKRASSRPVAGAEDAPDPAAADDVRRRDLALDVRAALDELPPDLRDLADALAASTVSDVSRRTGIPRTTLRGRLAKVRIAFDRADLGDYL